MTFSWTVKGYQTRGRGVFFSFFIFLHKGDNMYEKWVCYSLFLWRKSKKTQYFKWILKKKKKNAFWGGKIIWKNKILFFSQIFKNFKARKTMQLDFVVFFLSNSMCPKECGKITIFHPLALKWALQGTRRGFCIW